MAGQFITLEGGEGCGKTTQIKLLAEALAAAGRSITITREPGGSAGAEKIRELLVTGEADRWDSLTETLLFYAARTDHLARTVRPALAQGNIVICDRFSDSTRVYQGIGKGVSSQFIDTLRTLTLGNFAPSLTLILDVSPETGLARASARRGSEMRFEQLSLDFHQRVREGFLAIARAEPARCVLVDASKTVEEVAAEIKNVVFQRLGL
ncbi:MAG: dTMP kinase [Alphaproteobacteria bacterium]|nr:dTMP kinase [Alphaproteobacteria bacterium]